MGTLLETLDAFRVRFRLSDSEVGRVVMSDPNFMRELRGGRDVRLSTVGKIQRRMDDYARERPESEKVAA